MTILSGDKTSFRTDAPVVRELFADVREEIRATGLPEEELDARIEAAVKEVRKQRRA